MAWDIRVISRLWYGIPHESQPASMTEASSDFPLSLYRASWASWMLRPSSSSPSAPRKADLISFSEAYAAVSV